MSLHDSASQVQSAGRGEDKVLVHMTPNEVSGLQSLAMAHGGSLTINPHTGLPEAGFLSSLLPMAIGFGLAPLTGGLSAALITGAGYTAATGSLRKGIMAGLGAYGGAGLAGGLNAMGAASATATPAPVVDPSVAAANTQVGAGYNTIASTPQVQTFGQLNPAVTNTAAVNSSAVTPGMTSSNLNQTPVFDVSKYPNKFFPQTTPTAVPTTTTATTSATSPISPGSEYFTDINAKIRATSPISETAASPVSSGDFIGDVTNQNLRRQVHLANQGLIDQPITKQDLFSHFEPPPVRASNAIDLSKSAVPTASTAASNTAGQTISRPYTDYMSQVGEGAKKVYSGGMQGLKDLYAATEAAAPYSGVAGLGSTAMNYYDEKRAEMEEAARRRANRSPGLIRPYEFDYGATNVASEPYSGSGERTYFQPTYTELKPYKAPGPEYKAASGGLTSLAVGGPVEQMSAMNAVGANTGYPQARLQTPLYSNPMMQRPEATNVIAPSVDAGVGAYTGEVRFAEGGETQYGRSVAPGGHSGVTVDEYAAPSGYKYAYDPNTMQFTQTAGPGAKASSTPTATLTPVSQPAAPAQPLIPNIDVPAYRTPEQQLGLGGFYDYMNSQMGNYAGYAMGGGVSHLGDYSDGGRLLKGPGDGVSDSIPASIGDRQPARLADGEFVVPARIVSEIGNGSTEAGARKLYAMMDRVQRARKKTTGKNQVARNTKAEKLLPA